MGTIVSAAERTRAVGGRENESEKE